MHTSEIEALRAFRYHVYRILGCRRDALFDLIDAVLTTPVIESPAHLSLAPVFQRHWGSVYDARECRNDGSSCLRCADHAVSAPHHDRMVCGRRECLAALRRGNEPRAGLLPPSHTPVAWATHRRGLELLLAGPSPRTLFQLDGSVPGATYHTGREPTITWPQSKSVACCTHGTSPQPLCRSCPVMQAMTRFNLAWRSQMNRSAC